MTTDSVSVSPFSLLQRENAALRAELEDAKRQKKAGWERAAENDAAYGRMIEERNTYHDTLQLAKKLLDDIMTGRVNPEDEAEKFLRAFPL